MKIRIIEYISRRFTIINNLISFLGLRTTIKFLIARLRRSNKYIEILNIGLPETIWIRPHSADIWMLLQVFLHKEYQFASQFKLKNILDLGGNCGFTAIFMANLFPEAKIVTVEPDEDNFITLQKNISNYPNIVALNAAVWSKNCQVYLTNPTGDSSQKSFSEKSPNYNENITVVQAYDVVTISKMYGVSVWDFIKIDVEGAEIELLAAPQGWINYVNLIAIEIHDCCKDQAELLLKSFTYNWSKNLKINETHWRVRSGTR